MNKSSHALFDELGIAPLVSDDTTSPADRRTLIAAVVIGVGFDLWVNHRPTSLAGALFVILTALSLLGSGRLVSRQSRILMAIVPLFAIWLMLRTSAWLIPLNALAIVGLFGLSLATSTSGRLLDYAIRDFLGLPFRLIRQSLDTIGFVGRPLLADNDEMRRRRLVAVLVGLAMALPLLIVLAALLAMGDRAFGSLLADLGSGAVSTWIGLFIVGAAGGCALVRMASGADAEPHPKFAPMLGPLETMTVLSALIALYTLFVLAQVIDSISPASEVLQSPEQTRIWVHNGFFPLLWSAAITLSALLLLDNFARRATPRDRRMFASATATVVALALVVVAVAVYRIAEYSSTFGLTMLRLYSMLFACWIGVTFVLFALRVCGVAPRRNWLATAAAGAGLALLFGLNAANPEAMVVRQQIETLDGVDPAFLVSAHGHDAIPTLVEAIGVLPRETGDEIRARLCREVDDSPAGTLSWNRSRAEAQRSLEQLCDR